MTMLFRISLKLLSIQKITVILLQCCYKKSPVKLGFLVERTEKMSNFLMSELEKFDLIQE